MNTGEALTTLPHTTSRLGMEIDAALENDGRGKFLMR